MIVKDFDGNEYKWPPTGLVPLENERKKSSHHLRARDLLKKQFGSQRLMEEIPLPGTRLRLDFYLHASSLAVEVHGEQHYNYSPFFHGSAWAFIRARGNDVKKIEWCEINGITLLEFPYNESDDEWMNRIDQYLSGLPRSENL
jgi:very-short-patch-repair endonuclease